MSKPISDTEDQILLGLCWILAVYTVLQMFALLFGLLYGYIAKDPKCLPDSILGRINIGFNAGCELTKPRYK